MRISSRSITLSLILLAACGDPQRTLTPAGDPAQLAGGARSPRADERAALLAVRAGNAQSIVAAPALVPAGAPLAPFVEARLYAITNVAIHDALNAITPRYARYADTGPIEPDANAAAAALAAAHDAIVGAAPGATAATDAWYAS